MNVAATHAERDVLLRDCLEAARLELVRRMRRAGIPTTVTVQRLVVLDDVDGTGSRSSWEAVQVSPLQLSGLSHHLRDETVQLRAIGLRDQLQPLAEFLDANSNLGKPRQFGFLPASTGPEAILARYLSSAAVSYVAGLEDAAIADHVALDRFARELAVLCGSQTQHVRQLVLAGIRPAKPLGPHRGVSLRPLTPAERGAVMQADESSWLTPRLTSLDFALPTSFKHFWPTALLEVVTERPFGTFPDHSFLPNRVALAFFLNGFDISAAGSIAGFDRPQWASSGVTHSPFPVEEKNVAGTKKITKKAFEAIVDLAHKTPDFSGLEGSAREITLFRVLRGFGSRDSGFLDFAIALEAALLGEARTELRYRFSLYGALFLRDELPGEETFERLKAVYNARSKLVHGGHVKPEERQVAERDAAELARRITRRAIEFGWPSPRELDRLALTHDLNTGAPSDG